MAGTCLWTTDLKTLGTWAITMGVLFATVHPHHTASLQFHRHRREAIGKSGRYTSNSGNAEILRPLHTCPRSILGSPGVPHPCLIALLPTGINSKIGLVAVTLQSRWDSSVHGETRYLNKKLSGFVIIGLLSALTATCVETAVDLSRRLSPVASLVTSVR